MDVVNGDIMPSAGMRITVCNTIHYLYGPVLAQGRSVDALRRPPVSPVFGAGRVPWRCSTQRLLPVAETHADIGTAREFRPGHGPRPWDRRHLLQASLAAPARRRREEFAGHLSLASAARGGGRRPGLRSGACRGLFAHGRRRARRIERRNPDRDPTKRQGVFA